MQLYQWQGTAPNFGDELNTLVWPRLLADFFDDDPGELFLGIGSVLDDRHPPDAVKIVAGAGYGGHKETPNNVPTDYNSYRGRRARATARRARRSRWTGALRSPRTGP